jgi:hypothetical protein
MNVYVGDDPIRQLSASPGANVKASEVTRAQSPHAGVAVLSDAVAKEKAVMARLMLAALFGSISALAAILTTVIDWTVLAWRSFWLAVCVAGLVGLLVFIWMACALFSGHENVRDN